MSNNYCKRGKVHWGGFRGFSEKRESFSYDSYAPSINIYCSLALYHENITMKIHIYCGYRESLVQRSFPVYGIYFMLIEFESYT